MPENTAEQESRETSRFSLPAMSFLEHLEELRKRLINSIIAIVVGCGACWGFHERIFNVMQRPIVETLRHNGLSDKLVYLNPIEPFNLYLKIALLAGIFVASPVVLYQVWMFISPGLYRNEKKYVFPFMFSTIALFMAGGYFGFRVVYPQALKFLIDFGKQFNPMITIKEYTDLFLTVILGLGLIFELPVLVFFLALMGVVSAGWMWKNLRYAILGIFVVAGAIAPTPDVTSMCIFAAPMVILYLGSIGIAYVVHPTQRAAREAKKEQGR
jgi:sec-independent protein translocase protein TatC